MAVECLSKIESSDDRSYLQVHQRRLNAFQKWNPLMTGATSKCICGVQPPEKWLIHYFCLLLFTCPEQCDICLMNHQKTHQTMGFPRRSYSPPWSPWWPPTLPLGPMPLDPIGSLRSPVVTYKSSESPSNVAVDPMGKPLPPQRPPGPLRRPPFPPGTPLTSGGTV